MGLIFAVNENNDIYLDDTGKLATKTGLPATLQHCEHAMKTLLGEMVYAASRGIDYFGIVFIGSPNLLQFEAQARVALLRIPEVEEILSFDTEFLGNILEYTTELKTIFGQDSINGSVQLS